MGTSADIQDTYRAIEALMVIHNICIDLGDAPPSRNQKESDIPDSDSDDDPPFEPNDVCPGHLSANQVSQLQVGGWDGRNETAEWLRVEGRRVRDELQVLTHNRAAARR
ncbi:hypothetical protein RSOLAG1IB_11009 [Rhizoctonia solani AG-1 IB]|uniref:DDE Tnp4 domain-containing protein n=1 Tax=Thanatephorus cucumeris (strain AG1-IB / isolate 7/3/14) TaxID=1108050 RepID=A0A0B7G240_THACB|nr:hypothetical protein RSOLAG1IB_11009 [Rhizoctonia solani AG-1 IB]